MLSNLIISENWLLRVGLSKGVRDPDLMRIASEICPRYDGRALALTRFLKLMSETFKQDSRIKVAVVRGSADEQEITALGKIGFLTKVRVFGIDENCAFLDLNLSSSEVYDSEFDLVLCSQVWDHL